MARSSDVTQGSKFSVTVTSCTARSSQNGLSCQNTHSKNYQGSSKSSFLTLLVPASRHWQAGRLECWWCILGGLVRLWKGGLLSQHWPSHSGVLNSAYPSAQCPSSSSTMYLKHEWIHTKHLKSSREGTAGILYSFCLHGAWTLNKQISTPPPKVNEQPKTEWDVCQMLSEYRTLKYWMSLKLWEERVQYAQERGSETK